MLALLFVACIFTDCAALLPLRNIGWNPGYRLEECQGDCDGDSQCVEGLVCFERGIGDTGVIPGCYGTPHTGGYAYCVQPANEILTRVTRPLTDVDIHGTNLGVCEGDCDNDSQCVGDLICYVRSGWSNQHLPGCRGIPNGDTEYWDYCVHPYDEHELTDVSAQTLQECQGHCAHDGHCAGNLECFQRVSGDVRAIPGCHGNAQGQWDYCIDPNKPVPVFVRDPLLECYGDCESNNDCAADFICGHRSVGDPPPPGCFSDTDLTLFDAPNFNYARDFCYNSSNTLVNVGAQRTDLQQCQGNCVSSDDCAGYLKCFQREAEDSPTPPDCPGRAHSDWNYCYIPDPNVLCPDGTRQIGGDNADIAGCGVLEDCADNSGIDTIEACYSKCALNPYCRSFTFGMPHPLANGANDPDYPDTEECVLYNGDESTVASAKKQKMCAILGGEYERQLCYTSNSVTIGDSLNDGILSDTAVSNGVLFFDLTTENDLLTDASDYISIRLHAFADIDYASFLQIEIYSGTVIVSRVNSSDNAKYELMTVTDAPITAANDYSFWVQFNAEEATDTGFIRFGIGSTNTYSNEILHFPFQRFVDEGDTAKLRTSYEAFKYIAGAYVSTDGNTDVQMILYNSCKSEDELSAFVQSFGFLSNEEGVSGKVGMNVYVKNNVYSCVIEKVTGGKKNLCTNLQYTKSERCAHDSFRQMTHLYNYSMEITYFEDDYLVLDEFYLDDYVISVGEPIFVTNGDGDNKVLIAFKDDEESLDINGVIVDSSMLSSSLDPPNLSFGVNIVAKKSTQISIELFGKSNRYACRFIPSLIEGSLLSYSCVSNADSAELDDSRNVYDYVSYTQVDCLPEEMDQNQLKIIIESEGDIEVESVFITDGVNMGGRMDKFCGDTNEALCSSDPSATVTDTCDRLINCVDIGIASSTKPNIKPIIVFDVDVFLTTVAYHRVVEGYWDPVVLAEGGTLQVCEGDCDSDSDCAGDLICYHRAEGELAPGCRSHPYSTPRGHDICTVSNVNIDSYSNLFKLSITTCNTPQSSTGLSLLLKGVLGSSQREILTSLPSNNFKVYHIGSTAIGTFFSVQLEIDNDIDDSICLSQVILTDAVTNKVLFETDPSTIGKGIYLQKECAVPFKLLANNIFIPCYEQFFLLEAYNSRSYTKLTMELCAGDSTEVGLPKEGQTALSAVLTGLDKNGLFLTSDAIPLLSDTDWDTTTLMGSFREYNIIYDDFDIVSMSVVFINNDQSDAVCIDEVIINSETAILTNFWIGSETGADRPCSPSIPAVLSWPICKTEITDERVVLVSREPEEDTSDVLSNSCTNLNRFRSIECAASKSFAYSYSITEESSVSTSESKGTEIAKGFSKGSSFEVGDDITVAHGFEIGPDELKSTGGIERSASMSSGQSTERSRSQTTSTETTFERSQTFVADTTEESSISCEGSMEVGPFQTVNYDIIKARAISEYQTMTDFKLTKCSYILYEDDNNPVHFIYLMNIPGKLEFTETTSCSVNFYETQFEHAGSMTCREAQMIKGSEFDTYVPFCNPFNSEQWDPCQCETGDSKTDPTCYCVDAATGLTTDAIKASAVDTSITTWKTWCAQNCEGTQFEADQDLVDINGNVLTPAPVSADASAIANPQNVIDIIQEIHDIDSNSKNKYSVISDDKFEQIKVYLDEFLLLCGAFVSVLFCGVVMYCIKHFRSAKEEKYSKVAQFDFGTETEEV